MRFQSEAEFSFESWKRQNVDRDHPLPGETWCDEHSIRWGCNRFTGEVERVPSSHPLSASRYPYDSDWEDYLDRETLRHHQGKFSGSD